MASLLKACKQFERLALKTSLIENNDPILKRLSDIKEYDDRVKFAKEHWEVLGEGSARIVLKISDELIIKCAINDKGIAQDKTEMELDLQKSCANPVIAADKDGKWIITYFTKNITKDDFKKYVGFSFDPFISALFYAYNNEDDHWAKPREYDDIKHHPLFECLGQMIVDGELLIGDLDKPSSYGLKDGKILIRDFGFSKPVHDEFYSDKSSSSAKTSS